MRPSASLRRSDDLLLEQGDARREAILHGCVIGVRIAVVVRNDVRVQEQQIHAFKLQQPEAALQTATDGGFDVRCRR